MGDSFAFLTFCAVLSVLSLIFVRSFVDFLVLLLIVMQPLSHVSFIPREIFGIPGANPANFVWLSLFAVIALELAGRRTGIALTPFFSLPICLFLFLFLVAVVRSATDLGSFHVMDSSLIGKSSVHFILQELIKPTQILLTGWIVWIYCGLKRNDEIVRIALLCIPVILAPIVFGFFLSGTVAGGYMRGRSMISSSMGLHANDVGAFAVYLLSFALFSSSTRKLLRAAAIGSSILIIALSFSRMALITTVVISIIGFRRISKIERRILIVAAVLVLSVFFQELTSRAQFGIEEETGVGGVSAGRVDDIWLPLLPQVLEHPVVGDGILTIHKSEAARQGLTVRHPHNAYLQILLDMGIIGLLSFAFVVYWFVTCSRFAMEFRFAIVGWLSMGLTGNSFYPTTANSPIWILYGLALFSSRFRSSNSSVAARVEPPTEARGLEEKPARSIVHRRPGD